MPVRLVVADAARAGGAGDRPAGVRVAQRHVVDAAGGPRVAAPEAARRHPRAAQHAVALQRGHGVGRARRVVAAGGRPHRGDDLLVAADQPDQRGCQHPTDAHATPPSRPITLCNNGSSASASSP